MKKLGVILALALCITAQSTELFHSKGQLRFYRAIGENLSTTEFISKYYPFSNASGFQWRVVRTVKDATHRHDRFQLFLRGRRVVFHFLNVHTRHDGAVDFATSTFRQNFSLSPLRHVELSPAQIEARLKKQWKISARSQTRFDMDPVVYFDRKSETASYAFEVRLLERSPRLGRHVIVDAMNAEVLDERRTHRNASQPVYKIHPDRTSPGDGAPLASETIPSVTTFLSDGTAHVRREEDSINRDKVDINVNTNYSAQGAFGANGNSGDYNFACDSNGVTTGCPNQSFDGVNVFYHLKHYRAAIDAHLTSTGTSMSFPLDPIDVSINTNSIDTDSPPDDDGVQFNNAFYASLTLDVDGLPRSGLFFLPPADLAGPPTPSPICPSAVLYDLAREAVVVVHEYQHYITDAITSMIPGQGVLYNVGDSLHEGYSDYFAVSEITALNGEPVTEIGEYAFQNCAQLKRDIAVLKVFSNTEGGTVDEDFSDAHTVGWTWASGLWQLRDELGVAKADKIAFKSLFFLSQEPGFIEAVEAVVQADVALHDGENAQTIRTLFYNTLNFRGAMDADIFDADGSLSLGFTSCLSVRPAQRSAVSLALLLLWLGLTVLAGRLACRRA